jgi:GAF domain-containing protein/anti-anti-sigma regulatory factor
MAMRADRDTRYLHVAISDQEFHAAHSPRNGAADHTSDEREPPSAYHAQPLTAQAVTERVVLDQRLDDLLDSARRVLTRQGHLRHLLQPRDASQQPSSPGSLLPHLVAVAREFTGAGAAGLGVANIDRRFRFVSDGPEQGSHAAGDPSPEIATLAGRVVVEDRPLRLKSATEHAGLIGFPPDHQCGRSFLGVPVRQRERVGGYLYVSDKREAEEFTADDEALLQALASLTPAGAYQPAPLDAARPTASTELLTPAVSPLHLLLEAARRVGAADAAAVVLPDEHGWLRVASAEGQPWAGLAGQLLPAPRSVLAQAMRTGRTVLVPDGATDPRTCTSTTSTRVEPLLAAPLMTCGQLRGVLTLGRAAGGRPFDQDDSKVVTALAAHAGPLVDLVQRCPLGGVNGVDAGLPVVAAQWDADLQHRLVVYAATLHALVPHARRSRVLTDLLRQAGELRQRLEGGAAMLRDLGGTSARHVNPRGCAALDEQLDGQASRSPARRPVENGSHLTTRLTDVRRKLQDLIDCSDIDELATHVVRDAMDDLGWLIDGGSTPQPAAPEHDGVYSHDATAERNGSAGGLRIRVDRSRRCSVIHLIGSVSLTTASPVSTAVAKELAEAPAGIVIDLAGAALADELGASVIVSVARRAEREHETRVVVAAPPAPMMARLRRVASDVDIFDTVPAAVDGLRIDRHPRTFRLRLPFGPAAGLQARRLVEHACLTWRQDQLCDDALLIASELVGNAVQHGLAPVELTIARRKRHMHIQVADASAHPPALLGPRPAADGHGFGLVLVDTLATSWGCRHTETGKIIWAMLRTA